MLSHTTDPTAENWPQPIELQWRVSGGETRGGGGGGGGSLSLKT